MVNWMVLSLLSTLTGGAGSAGILLVAGLAGISRPLLGAFIDDRDWPRLLAGAGNCLAKKV